MNSESAEHRPQPPKTPADDKYATQELPALDLDSVEELPPRSRRVMTFNPGEVGGVGPFDSISYSDQGLLDFLFSTHNTIPVDRRQDFAAELKVWQEMRQRFLDAEIIFIPTIGGIGDGLYQAGAAAEIARQFPEKTVIVQTALSEPYQVPADLPNLQFVEPGLTRTGQHVPGFTTPEILDQVNQKKTFVLNLSPSGNLFFVFEPLNLERLGLPTDKKPSEITLFDQVPKPNDEGKISRHTMWSSWRISMIPPSSPKANDIDLLFPEMRSIRIFVAHQVDDLASKLHVLTGMDISAEFPPFPIREIPIPPESSYDYFFVYDAEAKTIPDSDDIPENIKVIGEKTLTNVITELLARDSQTRIAVVKGRSHPDIAEAIRTQFPHVTIVEGSFQHVLTEGLKSDMIINSDTGLGHFFEAQLQQCRRPDYQGRKPQQIVFFASDSPFPLTEFGLRYARNVLIEGNLLNLPAPAILDNLH